MKQNNILSRLLTTVYLLLFTYYLLMSWHNQQILYHIYSLGFCGCPEVNPIALPNPHPNQTDPVHRLNKIRDYYAHFQKMGITTIYLGPIFESCTHGYDIIDYFLLDRRLGPNELLKEIINELHSLKIKVIIDGCFHHVSRLFPPFVNLRENKTSSPFADWFIDIDYTGNTVWNDGFSYKCYRHLSELPMINFDHPDVINFFNRVAEHWLTDFDIDGWRLDVAYQFTPEQWQRFCQTCYQIKPDCFIYGELIEHNYSQYVNSKTFCSATNYQLYENCWRSLTQRNYYQLADFINYQKENYHNLNLLNFTGNHDTNRLHTQLYHPEFISQYLTLLFMLPDQPTIYYGDEINLTGLADNLNNNIRQPMPNLNSISPLQEKTINLIKELSAIRQNIQPNLANLEIIKTTHHYIIFNYSHQPDYFIIIHSYHYPANAIQTNLPAGHYIDILTNQSFFLNPEFPLKLTANQPLILKKIN